MAEQAGDSGIGATSGDLIGMIDDDEEVDVNWVQVIGRVFADPALEFAGGPYVPVWDTPAPDWMPEEYLAVLGAVDNGPDSRPYSRAFDGILKGGNAVVRVSPKTLTIQNGSAPWCVTRSDVDGSRRPYTGACQPSPVAGSASNRSPNR